MADIVNARDKFKFGTGHSPAFIPHVTRLQETIQPVGPRPHAKYMKLSFNFRVSYNKRRSEMSAYTCTVYFVIAY